MVEQQTDIHEQLGLNPSVYARLTDDEMAVVLAVLQIPRIVGYDIPEDFSPDAATAARHTLEARGGAMMQPDGTMLLEEGVAALVSSGARWARLVTLVVSFETGVTEQHWLYMGRREPVHHSIPQPGIHQFQTVPDGKSMLLVLAGLLRMRLRNQAYPGDTEFDIDPKVIDDADAARAAGGAEAAYQAVLATGAPELFAAAAAQPTLSAGVSVTWPTTGVPNANGDIEFTERSFWVLGAPDDQGYWILMPEKGKVHVIPANPQKVLKVIGSFVVEDLPTQ